MGDTFFRLVPPALLNKNNNIRYSPRLRNCIMPTKKSLNESMYSIHYTFTNL